MLKLHVDKVVPFLAQEEIQGQLENSEPVLQKLINADTEASGNLGWLCGSPVSAELLEEIENIAQEIRKSDVFVLIGVGGSNQGARAVIKALQTRNKPRIVYAGNNLSACYLEKVLADLEGKSVYANVIAKNFATLEPGICFRMIRKFMEKQYGEQASSRIIATGSPNNSNLEIFSRSGSL